MGPGRAPSDEHARALVTEVRRRLADAGDPAKAPAMQAYMKSTMPFRGINAKPLASLCRELFDRHPLPDESSWRAAVLALWDDARFREERYAAIALTGHRLYRAHQTPQALDLYRHLVVTGAWWDLVDVLASNRVGPILLSHRAEMTPLVRSWALDEDLWLRRAAILCQLRAKGETDLDLLRLVVEANLEESTYGREFFIRKAIGWALREHAKTDAGWVVSFVAEHENQLSGLSRREALKNVRGEVATTE